MEDIKISKFTFFNSFYETIKKLSNEDAGKLIKAMGQYVFENSEPELDGIVDILFPTIKANLLSGRNSIITGKNGGRPKKETIDIKYRNNNFKNIKPLVSNLENPPYENTETNENKNENENKNKKEKTNFSFHDLTFIENDNFKNLILDWINYKKSKNQSYKSLKSLESCYRHLLELSGDNVEKAKEIVETSIANNYSGLFPLNEKSSNFKNNSYSSGKSFMNVDVDKLGWNTFGDFELEKRRI